MEKLKNKYLNDKSYFLYESRWICRCDIIDLFCIVMHPLAVQVHSTFEIMLRSWIWLLWLLRGPIVILLMNLYLLHMKIFSILSKPIQMHINCMTHHCSFLHAFTPDLTIHQPIDSDKSILFLNSLVASNVPQGNFWRIPAETRRIPIDVLWRYWVSILMVFSPVLPCWWDLMPLPVSLSWAHVPCVIELLCVPLL